MLLDRITGSETIKMKFYLLGRKCNTSTVGVMVYQKWS